MSVIIDPSGDEFGNIWGGTAGDDTFDYIFGNDEIIGGGGYDVLRIPFFSRDVLILEVPDLDPIPLGERNPDPYGNTSGVITLKAPRGSSPDLGFASLFITTSEIERIELIDRAIVFVDPINRNVSSTTGNNQVPFNESTQNPSEEDAPFTLEPSQDPVTGQSIFVVPEGAPATLKRRPSDDDNVWGSQIKRKKNGKRKELFLVDNDFVLIEAFDPNDIISAPDDLSAYDIIPAPSLDGFAILVDVRSTPNVLALINDPDGFLIIGALA